MAGRGVLTDLAGAVVVAGAGYGVYREYQKSQHASTPAAIQQRTQQGGDGGGATQPVVKESAHDFLAKLADKGDDVAAKTLTTVKKQASRPELSLPSMPAPVVEEGPFRFDVTREGLASTLTSILDSKRTYEKNYLAECRRTGRYPADFAERCREMREEKEELKAMIDGLKPGNKKWWFFW